MLSKFCLLLFSCLCAELFFAQESVLFGNDQYSGISSAAISPTQPFINPNPWDVNLFGIDVFLQNDYAYISRQSVLGIPFVKIESASVRNNISGENLPNILDYYNKTTTTYHFSSNILGPSISIKTRIKDRDFSFGLFSKLRTESSTINADNYLRFGNQLIIEPLSYDMKPVQLHLMNWAEVGLNFSTQIFRNSDYQWIIGANLKYEIGLDALAVNSKEMEMKRTTEINENSDSLKVITAHNFNVDASFATNYDFAGKRYRFQQNGKGFGLDFGLAFVDKDELSNVYNSKFSFNILDLGYVNFKGENHSLIGQSLRLTDNPAFDGMDFESPQKTLQIISKEVYGNAAQSLTGKDFTIGLPTSLHLSYSRNIGGNHYLNADWFQRFPVFPNSLKRSNIVNLSYTVQKPVVGYGISTSLYEYRNLQFGGYLRIGPVIFGSENLLPLFVKHPKFHATDFYFAIKLYPFWDDEVKRHRRKKCNCD